MNSCIRPKYLPILSLFYGITMFASGLLTNKLVDVHGIVACGASFIVPFWYLIGDVITEVYGYKVCGQLIVATMVAYVFYAFSIKIVINFPSPLFWHLESEYQHVLGVFLRVSIAGTIASLVSGFLNSYLLSRWKILLNGKFFPLRSLGSSIIGQLSFVIIVNLIAFWGKVNIIPLLQIMFVSLIIKIFFSIFGVLPATLLANFLKRKEGIDTFDNHIDFNPFKLYQDAEQQ